MPPDPCNFHRDLPTHSDPSVAVNGRTEKRRLGLHALTRGDPCDLLEAPGERLLGGGEDEGLGAEDDAISTSVKKLCDHAAMPFVKRLCDQPPKHAEHGGPRWNIGLTSWPWKGRLF